MNNTDKISIASKRSGGVPKAIKNRILGSDCSSNNGGKSRIAHTHASGGKVNIFNREDGDTHRKNLFGAHRVILSLNF